jgi:hypothetical protein
LALAGHAYAQSDAQRAAAAGELVNLKGQRVLRLFGTDARERGFAHGYFLAADVVVAIEDALKSLPLFTAEKFEKQLVPWATRKFAWDAEATAELEGLYAGMCARLGAKGLLCQPLGRPLRQDDLYAANVVADWFGPACSAFTVWGALTEDGKVIHARNLDFPIGPRASATQVVLAVSPAPASATRPARRAWVGVGWPGLISVYSGMNSEGLVCCLHDAMNVVRNGARDGFIARGLLLRRMLETLDPSEGDPAEAAARMAAERPVASGNLFHLSWPRAAADKARMAPTAVLEFDSAGRDGSSKPVAIRRPSDAAFIALTNHYCVRRPPLECGRFERLQQGLTQVSRDSARLDAASARKLLICAEQTVVAHTLVFLPDQRALTVSITRNNLLATRTPGTEFAWGELFAAAK